MVLTGKRDIEELTEEEWDKLCEYVDFPERKLEFRERFEKLIIEWFKGRENEVLHVMLDVNETPIWNGKSYRKVMEERNELENKVKESRKRNNGGINKDMAIEILRWGHASVEPLSKIGNEEFIQLTQDVLKLAEQDKYFDAAYKLMKKIYKSGGISGATKLIGLSNQDKLCIYDSRVGHYLSDLKAGCRKLILHPPGHSYCSKIDHTTQRSWAKNYERLIWTLEILRDYLVERTAQLGNPFKPRIADIELAFFALGIFVRTYAKLVI